MKKLLAVIAIMSAFLAPLSAGQETSTPPPP